MIFLFGYFARIFFSTSGHRQPSGSRASNTSSITSAVSTIFLNSLKKAFLLLSDNFVRKMELDTITFEVKSRTFVFVFFLLSFHSLLIFLSI